MRGCQFPAYVVRQVLSPDGTYHDRNVKLVILSTQAWARTLAHELGHVFGLPHSTYPISIMNKSERKDPPPDQRTFDPKELAAMKPRIAYFVKSGALVATRP